MLFCGGWVGVSFINIMSIWQASLILNTQFIVFSIFTELCNRCCCSVTQLCSTLCDPMDCSTLGFPALHYLPGFAQTHVHWVNDAIQLTHPLLSPSPPAPNPSQHQGPFQWVSSSHHVIKVLELQHQVCICSSQAPNLSALPFPLF